jgi:hypothetical protein
MGLHMALFGIYMPKFCLHFSGFQWTSLQSQGTFALLGYKLLLCIVWTYSTFYLQFWSQGLTQRVNVTRMDMEWMNKCTWKQIDFPGRSYFENSGSRNSHADWLFTISSLETYTDENAYVCKHVHTPTHTKHTSYSYSGKSNSSSIESPANLSLSLIFSYNIYLLFNSQGNWPYSILPSILVFSSFPLCSK